jgi:predicted nucleic acid-binding protein
MATRTVIADASALIALAQAGQLSLLHGLFGQIFIPLAVAREIEPSVPDLPEWIVVRPTKRPSVDHIFTARLGAGETEVLCLALDSPDSWIILDDWRARRLAQQLGLRVLGTAAVLVEAKRAGLIAAVRPILDGILARGFHLGPHVYKNILESAGEILS